MSIRWFPHFRLGRPTPLSEAAGKNGASSRPTAVVLFLCHEMPALAAREFERIAETVRLIADCRVLFHRKADTDMAAVGEYPVYAFTEESLAALPYQWLFKNAVVPGSTHFPLMQFFRDFPGYEYYWLIEGDVKFSGDWKRFFNAFAANTADFLTCYLRHHAADPGWYWWPTLSHPEQEISLADRLCSFNPIYRISRRAVEHLHECHCEGWRGHFEVLIPTLLYHGGFRLQDLGGEGEFVVPGGENRFYTGKTVRFRPVFRRTGWRRNKLYHPVKCL